MRLHGFFLPGLGLELGIGADGCGCALPRGCTFWSAHFK
jgi:hypothetical protein